MKAKVEAELKRLVLSDVLSTIDWCDWGTHMVRLKQYDSVQICCDFKVTLNANLEVERYPLPRVKDLFVENLKAELYSKIDLSEAHMQFKLDKLSQALCTISRPLHIRVALLTNVCLMRFLQQRDISKEKFNRHCKA